jgi:hypothetical protein
MPLLHDGDPVRPRGSRADVVPLVLEELPERIAHAGLVVDHEDAPAHGVDL